MTPDALFTRARHLAAQRRITLPEALAELGKRGSAKRNYGRARSKADKTTGAVESPRFWWMDR